MMERFKRWMASFVAFLEVDLGDDDLNRRAFTLTVAIFYLFAAALAQMVVVMLFSGYRPTPLPEGGVAPMPFWVRLTSIFVMLILIADFVAYAWVRSGHVTLAAWSLVGILTLYSVVEAVVFWMRGGWDIFFLVPALLATLTISWRLGAGLVGFYVVFHMVLIHLRYLGYLRGTSGLVPAERMAVEIVNVMIAYPFLLVMVGVTLFLLRRSLRESREAQRTAELLSVALEERLEVQEEMRQLLEQAVERYADFLVEAAEGQEVELLHTEEIGEQLSASEIAQAVGESLRKLGEAINETVQRLWALLRESETALREAEAARRRYLRRAWQEYLREQQKEHWITEGTLVDETSLQEALEDALRQRRMAVKRDEQVEALAMPISVGDQIVGYLALQQAVEKSASRWSEDEMRLVMSVLERLAMTLNNLRLLDETQRREAKERFISQFTTQLRSAATVEEALADAMQALRTVFNAEEVVTHLHVETVEGGGE